MILHCWGFVFDSDNCFGQTKCFLVSKLIFFTGMKLPTVLKVTWENPKQFNIRVAFKSGERAANGALGARNLHLKKSLLDH